MPVMDGYTATRRLRERGCRVPVFALTANAMKGFEHEIEAAGFSGHMTKPVDIDAMLAELARHLGGQRAATPPSGDQFAGVAEAEGVVAPSHLTPSTPSTFGAGTALPAGHPRPAAAPIVSRLANHPRLQRVVRNFALQLPDKLDEMQDALTRGEWKLLAGLAHWLKGAGGTVGYDEFFDPALELEQHATAGDAAAAGSSLAQVRALVARLVVPDAPATADAAVATH